MYQSILRSIQITSTHIYALSRSRSSKGSNHVFAILVSFEKFVFLSRLQFPLPPLFPATSPLQGGVRRELGQGEGR